MLIEIMYKAAVLIDIVYSVFPRLNAVAIKKFHAALRCGVYLTVAFIRGTAFINLSTIKPVVN